MNDFEVEIPESDAIWLSQRIAQNIATRRARAAQLGLDFEKMAGLTDMADAATAMALLQISCDAIQLEQEPLGPPVRPWRHPLLWLKQKSHALVLHYVSRLGYRQMVFNKAAVRLLEHILAEHEAEVAQLKAQFADLAQQLRSVEQQER
jgi:hypothetical protein